MASMTEIQATLDALCQGVNGYGLSRENRTGERAANQSLTYGEMMLEPFARIVDRVKPEAGETFYDLGSGTGKVLVMADALHGFGGITGIECLPVLNEAASGVLKRYEAEFRPTLSGSMAPLVSRQGDMLTEDLTHADVVFVHSTCMGEELITALGASVRTCKPGTRFVLISRGFFGLSWFRELERFDYTNAWNTESTCFIYQLSDVALSNRARTLEVAG
jgi:Histone methylation protein DOT1